MSIPTLSKTLKTPFLIIPNAFFQEINFDEEIKFLSRMIIMYTFHLANRRII